jgi:hypothetical protein
MHESQVSLLFVYEYNVFLTGIYYGHYLLACPAWDHLPPPLFRASMAAGSFGSLHLPTLLNDTFLLKPLVKFIEATGRFADL